MVAIEINKFLSRLQSLQRLCSNTDPAYPKALLFVLGQDGRNNRGSITVLKYLYTLSVGKELLDETLDFASESLEDLIMLVKPNSLTVIWTHGMRKILYPMFRHAPLLVEYLSSEAEEAEIDLVQARKCCDFKRMIIEEVPDQSIIGIPIPIGYESAQDVEGWPILQAFAAEQVYCSTGFFTAKYRIADITENLAVLVRTVDCCYVDNAINSMNKTIRPHVLQTISMLDEATAEQRMKVKAEDVVGPMEVLFEFGEMDSATGKIDPSLRPLALFGSYTTQIGSGDGHHSDKWREQCAQTSPHAIIEGCDPSSGLRWCRTYFLRRGKYVAALERNDTVVDSGTIEESKCGDSPIPIAIRKVLSRLESIYVKLWIALRHTVKIIFARHNDVLEAGGEVQTTLEGLFQGTNNSLDFAKQFGLDLDNVTLSSDEKLIVHIDCMNAFGEVISIEDVDDMGGSCWIYVRVVVDGLAIGEKEFGTVAVGDTFLFSSLSTYSVVDVIPGVLGSRAPQNKLHLAHGLLPLLSDGLCVTHALPYYRALVGPGMEEKSSFRLLSYLKSPHLLDQLGLGKHLDFNAAGVVSVPIITDHPLLPIINAEVRVYTEGLVLERLMDCTSLPVAISIGTHVEGMWTLNTAECGKQVESLLPSDLPTELRNAYMELPGGMIIVFKLRSFVEKEGLCGYEYNPLARALPDMATNLPKYLGIYIQDGSRIASTMTTVTSAWHVALRLHDIEDHRGSKGDALPEDVLRSIVTAIDSWSYISKADAIEIQQEFNINPEELLSLSKYGTHFPEQALPGMGYQLMRCMHSLSEIRRLSPIDYESILQNDVYTHQYSTNKNLLVLFGHSGSGILTFSNNFTHQLESVMADTQIVHSIMDCSNVTDVLDIKSFCDQVPATTSNSNTVLLISVIISARQCVMLPDLLQLLEISINCKASVVISLLSPASLKIGSAIAEKYSAKPFTSTGFGIGHEKWNAVNLMMCSASVCDFAIAVVDPSKTSVGNTDAYSTFRFHMQNLYPSVQLIKIQQANLRLENDELDLITQKLFTKSGTTKVLTEREAIHLSRGGITSEFLKLDSISIAFEGSLNPSYLNCGLHSSIIFANDLRVVEWNMTSLVKVLQLIFPQSKLSTSALSDTWCVPSNQGKSGFARAVQLAKAKVYYTRESNEGKKLFDTILSEVSANHKKQISFLRKGIKGIYGVCEVHAGLSLNGKNDTAVSTKTNTHLFLVEACSAYVIVRPYLFDEKIIHKRLANESKLTVEGIFSDSDENFLKDLFRYCAQHKLAKKRLLTPLDLTTTEREKIQFLKQFRERELPSGWWFDGQSFVDINGTRLSIRPDINDIMNEYLVEENKRIRAFNDLLHNF